MAYIVNFTIIMQVIFDLVVNARLRLSRRLVKLVFKAYSISEERCKVHMEIKEHVKVAGLSDRDAALAKIIQLIKEYQMNPESMDQLQSTVKMFENNEDEDWDVGKAWLNHSITRLLCCMDANAIIRTKMSREADVSTKEYKWATDLNEKKPVEWDPGHWFRTKSWRDERRYTQSSLDLLPHTDISGRQ